MQNLPDLKHIPVYTFKDVELLREICDLYADSKYTKKDPVSLLSDSQLLLLDKLKNALNVTQLNAELCSKLKEAFTDLVEIQLELPYAPTYEMAVELAKWFRNNNYPNSYIKLTKTTEIILGAKIYVNGTFIDLSLDDKIKEVLSNKLRD